MPQSRHPLMHNATSASETRPDSITQLSHCAVTDTHIDREGLTLVTTSVSKLTASSRRTNVNNNSENKKIIYKGVLDSPIEDSTGARDVLPSSSLVPDRSSIDYGNSPGVPSSDGRAIDNTASGCRSNNMIVNPGTMCDHSVGLVSDQTIPRIVCNSFRFYVPTPSASPLSISSVTFSSKQHDQLAIDVTNDTRGL